jgi:hypothetical protein
LIFDASDNVFTNGPELPNVLRNGACTIFNSAMHGYRPVVFACGSYFKPLENKAQLLDYTLGNTWEESKHDFRLNKIYVLISCKKYHRLLLEFDLNTYKRIFFSS